jgi:hypothetical protein
MYFCYIREKSPAAITKPVNESKAFLPLSIREGAPSNLRTDNFAGKSSTRLVISLHSILRKWIDGQNF